jgi:glyoxylate reductase
MVTPSILVTRRLPSAILDKLRAVGDVDVYAGDAAIPPAELRTRIVAKRALVCLRTDSIDRTVIDLAPDLHVIANVGVGFDNIDVAHAASRGIVVTHTPDVLTESVADFTWGLIFAITRRLAEGERLVRRGEWKGWALELLLGTEVRGKQLGLIGVGRIGRAVAARAPAFGMKVAYTSAREVDLAGATPMSLDRLLLTSDVVSLHVPLTDETRHLIDARRLALMKRDAVLVNTSRGPVVDEEALAVALEEGAIFAAGLDVYEREPEVHPRLLAAPRAVLFPHIGSASLATRTRMAQVAAENVVAVLAGERPNNPVTGG